MIVAREETSRTYLSTGIWGRVTLDQLLEKNAATRPDQLAVADFSDRADWTIGRAQQLTYAELNRRVEALAAFFAGLGLVADSVIALQMPATSDAVVVFFAAMRAGLVVAPLPLAWREADVMEALAQTGAKAIVTISETQGERHGERMRNVAVELFQIRFIFGTGGLVPDGVIDLDRVFDEGDALGAAPNLVRKGNAADHAATIAWSVPPYGGYAVPLARSHNHWIAAGLMTLLEAKIDQTSVILCPMAPAGILALGSCVLPWLLGGGTLVLGQPASVERIAETAVEFNVTHVLVPQRFARRLAERLEAHRTTPTLMVAVAERPADAVMPRGHTIVDLTAIGEFGLTAIRRRDHSSIDPLPIGTVGAPSQAGFAPMLIETQVVPVVRSTGEKARGLAEQCELRVRGPMVPEFLWGASGRTMPTGETFDHWTPTGILVTVRSVNPPVFEVLGPVGDVTSRGPLGFDLRQIDQLYQSIDGVADAAAVLFPDPGSQRVAAIIVPKPGFPFKAEDFIAAVEARRVGLHKIPVEVFVVPSIARAANDRVMRTGMASRLAAQAGAQRA